MCARLRPDVLTLDLAMPGLDGIGVLRALRDAASPIPVVVVSAFSPAHGARAVDALAEGAVDLVAKPVAGEPRSAVRRRAGREGARGRRLAGAPRGGRAALTRPRPPPPPPVAAAAPPPRRRTRRRS